MQWEKVLEGPYCFVAQQREMFLSPGTEEKIDEGMGGRFLAERSYLLALAIAFR